MPATDDASGAAAPGAPRSPDPHDHAAAVSGFGGGPECTLCPVCAALQALTSTRPEAMQHLLAAGRELLLAVTAVLEQQADAQRRAGQRLQHIPVD